jgi:hypothetical protein
MISLWRKARNYSVKNNRKGKNILTSLIEDETENVLK